MKKNELVSVVAEKTGLTQKDVTSVIDEMSKTIVKTCVDDGEEVNLPAIGKFKPKINHARKGINPLTKKAIDIPESHTIKFTPIPSVKKIIDKKKKKK